jgi:hypothetical protein
MKTRVYMNLKLPTKLDTETMEYSHTMIKCEIMRVDFTTNTMRIRYEHDGKVRRQNVDATSFINRHIRKVIL